MLNSVDNECLELCEYDIDNLNVYMQLLDEDLFVHPLNIKNIRRVFYQTYPEFKKNWLTVIHNKFCKDNIDYTKMFMTRLLLSTL